MTERLYLITRNQEKVNNKVISETFTCLGSTGNVYDVKIAQIPSCTCPDYEKGNLCKHIFFVYLKVLKLDQSRDTVYYQRALLESELDYIFNEQKSADKRNLELTGIMANEKVIKKLKEIKEGKEFDPMEQKEIGSDEECLVCFELMKKEAVTFCKVCGNNIHQDCWSFWSKKKKKEGKVPDCIFCRAPELGNTCAYKSKEIDGYNLGDLQGQPSIRNTDPEKKEKEIIIEQ